MTTTTCLTRARQISARLLEGPRRDGCDSYRTRRGAAFFLEVEGANTGASSSFSYPDRSSYISDLSTITISSVSLTPFFSRSTSICTATFTCTFPIYSAIWSDRVAIGFLQTPLTQPTSTSLALTAQPLSPTCSTPLSNWQTSSMPDSIPLSSPRKNLCQGVPPSVQTLVCVLCVLSCASCPVRQDAWLGCNTIPTPLGPQKPFGRCLI
ncbi:hypothetical protein BGX38DRAFT_597770 [Terfezia claveryi]|nr:hypothetical protein BGX38DRAFT_597770 [Terfezia claveryi]